MLVQFFETTENSMPKGTSKVVVDAERNRRPLEKPANQFLWFEGGAGSSAAKRVPKTRPKNTKKVSTWDPRSIQNRAGAAAAFVERSGRPKQFRVRRVVSGPILGSIFRKNYKNTIRKGIYKSM